MEYQAVSEFIEKIQDIDEISSICAFNSLVNVLIMMKNEIIDIKSKLTPTAVGQDVEDLPEYKSLNDDESLLKNMISYLKMEKFSQEYHNVFQSGFNFTVEFYDKLENKLLSLKNIKFEKYIEQLNTDLEDCRQKSAEKKPGKFETMFNKFKNSFKF